MAWPAVKKPCTQDEFQEYVDHLRWGGWRPKLIVWHNTWAPTLVQWAKTAEEDRRKGLIPGTTRINNLEYYFQSKGWSGGPHLFIAPDFIWIFNRLTAPGVHSPSWNNRSIGIEMVGNFSTESDESGDGFKVKNHCLFSTAVICAAVGLNPFEAIKLHREDPRTTHKTCPGDNIASDKVEMMKAVDSLMSGGEHAPEVPEAEPAGRRGVVLVDGLNVRTGPGVTNPTTGHPLWKNAVVTVLGEAKNGSTSWLRIRTPGGFEPFWVAGRFVRVE